MSSRDGGRTSWRGVVEPLRDHMFARFFTAQCLSFVGDAMLMTTLPLTLLRYHFTGGAFGFVLTATSVARIVGLFLGGGLADRFRRTVLLVIADCLCGAVQLTVVALLLTGFHATAPLVGLYAVFGLGTALFLPASQGLIAQVSTDDTRVAANGLLTSAENLATVVVPAIGAAVVVAAGGIVGLAVDGVSFVLSAILLSTLRLPRIERDAEAPLFREARAAFAKVVRTGWLRSGVLSLIAINSFGFAPFFVLTPIVLTRLHEPAAWGLVLAVQAIGAVAGGVLVNRLRLRRPLAVAFGSCVTWAGMAAVIAVGAPLAVILAFSLVAGFCGSLVDVLWQTAVQGRLPTDQVGRISAFTSAGSLTVQPIAYALLAVIAMAATGSAVLVFCAGALVVLLAATCASRGIREFVGDTRVECGHRPT